MTKFLSLPVFLCLILYCQAVDRGNFKTCNQSGFCKRHRAMQEGQTPYTALLDTAEIKPTHVTVTLLNKKTSTKFLLTISGLKENMFRMRITETEPIRPRYEPPIGDSLVKEPEETEINAIKQGSESLTITEGNSRVIIRSEPFRIDIIDDGKPLITVNGRGLLKYELFKKEGQEEEEQKQPEENAENQPETVPEPEEPDLGSETFKGHTDSKPRGSSSVGLDFSFVNFAHVYGIPEHADTLALKSTKDTDPYRLYNLDVFEYELNNPMALYGSVPLMYAHNEEQTLGLFWLNAAETWIDISNNKADRNMFTKVFDLLKGDSEVPQVDTHWFSESGVIDVFFMLGPTPQDVFKQYAILTGTTPLPPLFSVAYHQCRWNYNDQDDVRTVDANFDQYDIPYDVIWLDIEHTDGKRYFTWDKSKFSEPGDMIKNISSKARKMVTVIDPHIKRDDNWELYSEARDKRLFVKNSGGSDFDGWCWPGSSSWLDFLNPEVREWYIDRFSLEKYTGSSVNLFTWNDMNEPSVFNGPEITMHKDSLHHGDWEHRDIHNIYGLYQQMASAQGQVKRSGGNERPFVLSRAFFAGSQRWGAVWTGDNLADWSHLQASIPMLLSISLTGITLCGADVGGFFKNPDIELLTRWYQAGAYQPFFRAHAHLDTRRREPWLHGEDNMQIIREAIRARYSLLPYWYTLFYNGEVNGGPVMRPLWVEFPKDQQTFTIDNEYLIGNALLVHPVAQSGSSGVTVYLPDTNTVWYDVDTYQKYNGGSNQYIPVDLHKIPVFQRGGTIVPRKTRIRRSSYLGRQDPYTLVLALDGKNTAQGDLYIDDYHTFRYQKRSDFVHRTFNFKNSQLENREAALSGKHITSSWLERVIIVGLNNKPSKITVSGPSIEKTELEFTYTPESNLLIIRKPGVNIATDWVINIV